MERTQFRVLFREFLFRIVDLEILSSRGDLTKLLCQLAALVAAVSLVVAGMNDVLNAQAFTQAAWWNRIPFAAWMLMVLIAIACNLLLGFGEHRTTGFLLILPLIISTSLFLIADIDSPRAGVIRIQPHNLVSACQSMKPTT